MSSNLSRINKRKQDLRKKSPQQNTGAAGWRQKFLCFIKFSFRKPLLLLRCLLLHCHAEVKVFRVSYCKPDFKINFLMWWFKMTRCKAIRLIVSLSSQHSLRTLNLNVHLSVKRKEIMRPCYDHVKYVKDEVVWVHSKNFTLQKWH